MSNSHIQLKIEKWIRTEWLPKKFGCSFEQHQVMLNTGGGFVFDAVSTGEKIVINISTSSATTSNGNMASAKMQKLRSDMLFLLMAPAEKRLVVLTEKDMFDLCEEEKRRGRISKEIDFDYVDNLPDDLKKALIEAKRVAAEEVTPKKA